MNPLKGLRFKDWVLIGFILLVMYLCCVSCTASRPRPAEQPPLTALVADSVSLEQQAQLPPYLVPAPAGLTKRQARQWQAARAHNLARAGHAPTSVKVKNSTVATGAGATAVAPGKHTSTAVGTGATSTQVASAKAPVATGSGRAQDFTGAAKHGGALATEPGASAGATTRTGVPPWLLGVGLVVLLLILLCGLGYYFRSSLARLLKISV